MNNYAQKICSGWSYIIVDKNDAEMDKMTNPKKKKKKKHEEAVPVFCNIIATQIFDL